MARPWIGAAAMAAIVMSCAPTQPSPMPEPNPTKASILRPSATPEPNPTKDATPARTPTPSSTALVPVVGFWSATAGISSADLDAALMGKSSAYRRVLVAGTLPRATPSTPDAIRAAVNADARTLGLLPAGEVTPDVRALAVDGFDLFGNDRVRDLADWPLLIPAAPGVDPPSFDLATSWTLVAGGDVMLDRSIYRRTVREGKGADYIWDGGFAEITGRRCCSAAGYRLPVVRRTGQAGAVRALFRDADLALVNLEGPAVEAFRWHPHGLVFTFDPALLSGLSEAGIDVVAIGNNHIGNAGPGGVIETIRHLDKLAIAHVGAGQDGATARAPAWFDIAGQRVALFGYDAVRPADHATLRRAGSAGLVSAHYRADVAAARDAGADVVVVLPHWGVEYRAAPTAKQRAHAKALAAVGSTLTLGSHSHWAGAMELVDGRPVLYSLGNLIFDLTRSEETVQGLIVEITFVGARPTQVRLHPTVMVDLVQPNLLDAAGDGTVVIKRMRKASEALQAR
jgi:poly-gamma-glutamate capsule biosynthesis protein CapA/YwtB (metallophosphatase superfamily)